MVDNSEIVRAVRQGLDNLEIVAAAGAPAWTGAVKTELCKIGRPFGYKVAARKHEVAKKHRDYGEWLYDVAWLEYQGEYVYDAPLVAEVEWGKPTDIDEDFQKLLLARADVRLMVFDGTYKPYYSEGVARRLARQVGEFQRSREGDVWLLAAWERSETNEKGWGFRYFTIEPTNGTAREL